MDSGTIGQAEFDKAVEKIRNRGATKDIKIGPAYCQDFKEPVPQDTRRRSRKRAPLSVEDKISIVHKVFVEKEM
jgi:hypothetical protein